MNLHEYQAKHILALYGIPIPDYGIAASLHEVDQVIKSLHLTEAVIKIQVHAGGRGKAGGVKFAKSPKEIRDIASKLLGMRMVNTQTGEEGVVAHRLMLSRPIDLKKEYYLGIVIDREKAMPTLLASIEGGMDIEELAKTSPEKLLKLPVEFDGRMRPFHLLRLAHFMGWHGEVAREGMRIAEGLAKAFIEKDASLIEINPLALTNENNLVALDAKLSVDDNALFRQPEISHMYDPSQQSKNEVAAKEYDLAYVALSGNIGCMVNGAGLAMATMDMIHLYGGAPANFLDVGGGASKEKVASGFKIILHDSKVKAILVNIFGGIMNCATLAEGVVAAASELSIKIPVIVRMEGTNVEEGKRILKGSSKLPITSVDSLKEAALKAVEAARK